MIITTSSNFKPFFCIFRESVHKERIFFNTPSFYCIFLPALLVVVEFVWRVCIRLIFVMRFAYVISMSGVGITSSPVSFPIWPDDSNQTDQRKNENKNYCYKKTKKKSCTKKPVEGNSYIFTRTSAHWTHAASSNNKASTGKNCFKQLLIFLLIY